MNRKKKWEFFFNRKLTFLAVMSATLPIKIQLFMKCIVFLGFFGESLVNPQMNGCVCQLSHMKTHIRSNVYRAQPSDQSVILLFSIRNKETNYLISHLLNCENLMDFKLERHLFMIFPVLFFLSMCVCGFITTC